MWRTPISKPHGMEAFCILPPERPKTNRPNGKLAMRFVSFFHPFALHCFRHAPEYGHANQKQNSKSEKKEYSPHIVFEKPPRPDAFASGLAARLQCDLIIFTVHFDNPLRLFAFSGFSDLQRVFSVAVFRRVEHRRVFFPFGGFYRLYLLNNLFRCKR